MYIYFDDTEFRPTSAEIEIAPYSGKRNVLSLDVYPIAMVRKNAAQKLEETIVARGKKFVKLTNVEHKRYTGLSIKKKSRRYEDIDSDGMIDFTLGYKNSYKEDEDYEIGIPYFDSGGLLDPTISFMEEFTAVVERMDDTKFELERCTSFLDSSGLLERRNLDMIKHDRAKKWIEKGCSCYPFE
ncbi:hypothetical protein BKA61DRAFT_112353 [Leptodontidium sp. MPI-SDFR-AT-0119]|nr:hypothetical protein BKA61DRAFT_112353 [Leptodontidium sp. MPI-SDFR-AT-0119]